MFYVIYKTLHYWEYLISFYAEMSLQLTQAEIIIHQSQFFLSFLNAEFYHRLPQPRTYSQGNALGTASMRVQGAHNTSKIKT